MFIEKKKSNNNFNKNDQNFKIFIAVIYYDNCIIFERCKIFRFFTFILE